MIKTKNAPKLLLVEGKEDERLIPELMEQNNIDWSTPPVIIKTYEGYTNLNDKYISVQLKQSNLTHLGLVVDADEDCSQRWQKIRDICANIMPNFPTKLEESGLIHETESNIKFGLWIMPDNQKQGMLETFLAYLIPNNEQSLWQYAQKVTQQAKQQGATFKDTHIDKANIYTWLAWQNPPGRQIHDAIKQKIFDSTHPQGQKFVQWFRNLYEIS